MKRSHIIAVMISSFVVATTAGFLIGRYTAPASADGGSGTDGPGGSRVTLLGENDAGGGAAQADQGGGGAAASGGEAVNVDALLQELLTSSGAMFSPRSMVKLFNRVEQLNLDQVKSALAKLDDEPMGQPRMMAEGFLLGRWAAINGPAAMEYYEANRDQPNNPFQGFAASNILSTWAEEDPEGVWEWYKANREDADSNGPRGMMVSIVIQQFAGRDPARVLEMIQELDGQDRMMAMNGLRPAALQKDSREAMLRELAEVEDDQLQQRGFQMVLEGWSQVDPHAAIDYYEERSDELTWDVGRELGLNWLMTGGREAADWLWESAPSDQKTAIVQHVVGRWANMDLNATEEWLNTFEMSAETDSAVQNFAFTASQSQPETGLKWAERITDPGTRESVLQSVAGTWATHDPVALRHYLETTPDLSPEQETALQNALQAQETAEAEQ